MVNGNTEAVRPFILKTQSGDIYPVTDRSQIWFPGPYADVVCIALPGKGITVLDIAAVEAVRLEVDVAAVAAAART
jgi:hypothetical protein